jgi:hypothetical protein
MRKKDEPDTVAERPSSVQSSAHVVPRPQRSRMGSPDRIAERMAIADHVCQACQHLRGSHGAVPPFPCYGHTKQGPCRCLGFIEAPPPEEEDTQP